MPVPGLQRNPLGQSLDRFKLPPIVFVPQLGRTPGLQDVDLQTGTQAKGTIRRLWRQTVNYLGVSAGLNWTTNRAGFDGTDGFQITRARRYKASSTYSQAGSDNTRFGAPRPKITARHNMPPATLSAGNKQSRPVIRNRIISFGKRVPPENQVSPAAQVTP